MAEELKCPICGSPTRVYMGNARKDGLCAKHAEQLKKGLLELKNGKFVFANQEPVKTKIVETKPVEKKNEDAEQNPVPIVKCIACGKETFNGNLFCASCYHKYKEKQLLVKITKCKEIEIMDESYEGMFVCKDGHIVKSKSERDIDNYLFDHGIPHAYEKAVPINANKNDDLHPDFYLPNFNESGKDVYIEHWGVNPNNKEYKKSMKYKIEKYKELGLTIISTYESDIKDPDTSLFRKLNHFEYGKINFPDGE